MGGGILKKNDYDSSIKKYIVQFDISDTEEAQYEDVITLNVGFDQGEILDTWQDLYNFLSNNVKIGLDPTWSLSLKMAKSSPVCQFILGKEFAVGVEATAKTKIVNLLKGATGKEINFVSTLSNITYDNNSEEVMTINFDLKVYDNSTFDEKDYTPNKG